MPRDRSSIAERYVKLREHHPQGSRQERGGPKYEGWSKEHLYYKAREVGIKGRSKMSKDELINALRYH